MALMAGSLTDDCASGEDDIKQFSLGSDSFYMLLTTGKSTFANLVEKQLLALWRQTHRLNGGNIRQGLSSDLGFSEPDQVENIGRLTEISKLFVDARLAVIVSFISPYCAERETLRSRFQSGEFLATFVDMPLQQCDRPAPKGPQTQARRRERANPTEIDAKYGAPKAPDFRSKTVAHEAQECLNRILLAFAPGSLLHAMDDWGAL